MKDKIDSPKDDDKAYSPEIGKVVLYCENGQEYPAIVLSRQDKTHGYNPVTPVALIRVFRAQAAGGDFDAHDVQRESENPNRYWKKPPSR